MVSGVESNSPCDRPLHNHHFITDLFAEPPWACLSLLRAHQLKPRLPAGFPESAQCTLKSDTRDPPVWADPVPGKEVPAIKSRFPTMIWFVLVIEEKHVLDQCLRPYSFFSVHLQSFLELLFHIVILYRRLVTVCAHNRHFVTDLPSQASLIPLGTGNLLKALLLGPCSYSWTLLVISIFLR